MAKTKVKLEKDLVDKAKKFADLSGYSSSEEFITHCLEKEISKLEESDSELGDTIDRNNELAAVNQSSRFHPAARSRKAALRKAAHGSHCSG